MTKFKNIAVAVASLVLFSNITNAQALKASYSANAEEPMKVKYLGDDGEYLLFQVTTQAKTPAGSVFAINDKSEGELYSAFLSSTYKVQTVKIEKRDEEQVLDFKLVSGKKTFSKSFAVNKSSVATTAVTEDVVTKL